MQGLGGARESPGHFGSTLASGCREPGTAASGQREAASSGKSNRPPSSRRFGLFVAVVSVAAPDGSYFPAELVGLGIARVPLGWRP